MTDFPEVVAGSQVLMTLGAEVLTYLFSQLKIIYPYEKHLRLIFICDTANIFIISASK